MDKLKFIDCLVKNIEQQTRNGRESIYLNISTIKELGININENINNTFMYIPIDVVDKAVKNYKIIHNI